MIQAQRLGHVTIETPDLEKSLDYFVNVNGFVVAGRDGDTVWLSSKIGQLGIALVRSTRADCGRIAMEIAPSDSLSDVVRALAKEGVGAEIRTDPFPGTSASVAFRDPKGTMVELFQEWSFITPNQNVAGIGPLKVGHIAFFTPDVQALVDFYQKVLGFRVSDWLGDFFVFMRCNCDHHTVNFFRGDKPRLHHLAFELKDFAHVNQACETLSTHRIPLGWGPLRHGPGHNIAAYHRNPDDHVIEYYCELDQMKNEDLGYFEPRPWHVDRPQRPKTWPAREWLSGWGTPPAPDYLRGRT